MEDPAAEEGQAVPEGGLSGLVTRMVEREQREAAEVKRGGLDDLAWLIDDEIDTLSAPAVVRRRAASSPPAPRAASPPRRRASASSCPPPLRRRA